MNTRSSKFCKAINSGNKKRIVNMLKKGQDANAKNVEGIPAIQLAIFRNDLSLIKCSLDDDSLRIAALMGYSTIVKILIANGADVNRLDAWLSTPIHWAVQESEIDIVKILIENGVDINIRWYRTNTIIYCSRRELL